MDENISGFAAEIAAKPFFFPPSTQRPGQVEKDRCWFDRYPPQRF
jgi:hypothetical protein